MRFHLSRSFWLAAVAATLVLGGRAQAQLVPTSPFLPPDGPATGVADPNTIEYRGNMSTDHGSLYLIYDPVKKTSTWVGLNEPGSPYAIKSDDAQHEKISLRVNGQQLSLTLKAPKVMAAPQMLTYGGGLNNPVGGPVILKPTPEDEQRRLQGVADEVRRRRQAREQAQQQGGPGR